VESRISRHGGGVLLAAVPFGHHRGFLHDSMGDGHVAKVACIRVDALGGEVGAEKGDEAPRYFVAEGCTDGFGACPWHPVT
jgi:hypothetical protein